MKLKHDKNITNKQTKKTFTKVTFKADLSAFCIQRIGDKIAVSQLPLKTLVSCSKLHTLKQSTYINCEIKEISLNLILF